MGVLTGETEGAPFVAVTVGKCGRFYSIFSFFNEKS